MIPRTRTFTWGSIHKFYSIYDSFKVWKSLFADDTAFYTSMISFIPETITDRDFIINEDKTKITVSGSRNQVNLPANGNTARTRRVLWRQTGTLRRTWTRSLHIEKWQSNQEAAPRKEAKEKINCKWEDYFIDNLTTSQVRLTLFETVIASQHPISANL